MAKISAYGAHEVARLNVNTMGGYPGILVIASDGRLLFRYSASGNGDLGSSYKVLGKVKNPAKRNAAMLTRYAAIAGYSER
jgi:hypothetical protein